MELKDSYKVIIILEHCIYSEVNGTVRYQVFLKSIDIEVLELDIDRYYIFLFRTIA